jgi:hypothetical protein
VTTVSTDPTGVKTAGVDPCPHCGTITSVQLVADTPPKVQAWSCAACRTEWAVTVVNPRPFLGHLTATVEFAAAQSVLREVIALADQAPGFTDEQLRLRFRLLALATRARSGSPAAHRSVAGRWSRNAPESVPGGQPVPTPDPGAEEIEALATLLADVVELTRSGAVYPGHLALIAEQARTYESVQRVLRGER